MEEAPAAGVGSADLPPTRHPGGVSLADLTPHLVCTLCGGYYIDATTIVQCLHTFCRACLLRRLQISRRCPTDGCGALVGSANIAVSLRSDTTLQSVVYKTVPGLHRNEMQRRRQFYTGKVHADPDRSLESKGDTPEHATHYYEPEDLLSVRVQYVTECPNEVVPVRYLRCPAGLPLSALSKFLHQKYQLSSQLHIELIHGDTVLPNDIRLLDVAYIGKWSRDSPLEVLFRLKKRCSPLSKRTASTLDPVSNSRTKVKKLNCGQGSVAEMEEPDDELLCLAARLPCSNDLLMTVPAEKASNTPLSRTAQTAAKQSNKEETSATTHEGAKRKLDPVAQSGRPHGTPRPDVSARGREASDQPHTSASVRNDQATNKPKLSLISAKKNTENKPHIVASSDRCKPKTVVDAQDVKKRHEMMNVGSDQKLISKPKVTCAPLGLGRDGKAKPSVGTASKHRACGKEKIRVPSCSPTQNAKKSKVSPNWCSQKTRKGREVAHSFHEPDGYIQDGHKQMCQDKMPEAIHYRCNESTPQDEDRMCNSQQKTYNDNTPQDEDRMKSNSVCDSQQNRCTDKTPQGEDRMKSNSVYDSRQRKQKPLTVKSDIGIIKASPDQRLSSAKDTALLSPKQQPVGKGETERAKRTVTTDSTGTEIPSTKIDCSVQTVPVYMISKTKYNPKKTRTASHGTNTVLSSSPLAKKNQMSRPKEVPAPNMALSRTNVTDVQPPKANRSNIGSSIFGTSLMENMGSLKDSYELQCSKTTCTPARKRPSHNSAKIMSIVESLKQRRSFSLLQKGCQQKTKVLLQDQKNVVSETPLLFAPPLTTSQQEFNSSNPFLVPAPVVTKTTACSNPSNVPAKPRSPSVSSPLHIETYSSSLPPLPGLSTLSSSASSRPVFPVLPLPQRPRSQSVHRSIPNPSLVRQRSAEERARDRNKSSPTAGATAPTLSPGGVTELHSLTRQLQEAGTSVTVTEAKW